MDTPVATLGDRRGLADRLLAWYGENRRHLPWRAAPGGCREPYRVWLSEIMLQQTTVATVRGHFDRFMARWPTVHDLAAADLDEVLHAWQGLGYYARARNLHKCARVVSGDLGGRFPETEDELLKLPGVGAYTAAAVAAIAFDAPATPVDGNIERVTARLFAVATPLPAGKAEIRDLAGSLTPAARPGDFAQAMMDLGAMVCTPRGPDCGACPWSGACRAHALGRAADFPVRPAKKPRPTRFGVAFWIEDPAGRVLLRRRPEDGLLGGMMEVPSTDWRETLWDEAEAAAQAPIEAAWDDLPGAVRHTFTHFHLELAVRRARAGRASDNLGVWVAPRDLGDHALPTVMKKVVRLVAGADGRDQSS